MTLPVLDHSERPMGTRSRGVRSLRIGLFTPNYPGLTGEGGIGTYVRNIGRALTGLGHHVHVLTPGEGTDVQDGDVHVHFTKSSHIAGLDRLVPGAGPCWRIGQRMQHLVREHALDVVEFPNWEGRALWFGWRRQVPLVVRLHTSSLETIKIEGGTFSRELRWDVRRERWTARMADMLVTHSQAHRQLMAEELRVETSRIRIVPHGIAAAPCDLPPLDRDAHTIVYLGRLEKRKGTIDLLNAVPKILQEYPEALFVLIGADRPHCPGGRTHAQFMAEEFPPPVRDRVKLMGRLPDDQVELWLRRATVFVAPSRYESFGLIFLEAMRWATPVVGTWAGGIPEIVEDERSGVLVPQEDPRSLANAIVGLLRSSERRCRLGEAGRQRCGREFSMQRMADGMIELYSEAVDLRRR